MPKICISRVTAGAVLSAVLTVGSLSLAATAASACTGSPHCDGGPPPAAAPAACTTPDCLKGVPPVTRVSFLECSEPKCLSGTDPAAARWPAARPAINCPPSIAARASGGGGPGC
jgi:hypothetical protein